MLHTICKYKFFYILIFILYSLSVHALLIEVPLPAGITPEDCMLMTGDTKELLDQAVKDFLKEHREYESKVSLVIMYVDSEGNPVYPDLLRLQKQGNQLSRAPSVDNELTFTFNSPDHPFTQEELDLIQPLIPEFYRIIKEIYGPPFFTITVNIKKDPDISYSGYYNSGTNEITMFSISEGRLKTLGHEIVHAFHDDKIISVSVFEEGFADCLENLIFHFMPEISEPQDYFGYPYCVYYEATNKLGIGVRAGRFSYGSDTGLALFRYCMSSLAWAKVYYENRDFFRLFNESYFDAYDADSSIRSDADRLFAIAAAIVAKVEHLPFEKWKAKQYIFDTSPPSGYQFASRISNNILDYLYRGDNGYEIPQEEVELRMDFYDYRNDFLGSSYETTSSYGFARFYPDQYDSEYRGRKKYLAYAESPEGTVEEVYYRTIESSGMEDLGAFGVVTRSIEGEITISSLEDSERTATVEVTEGSFYTPSLTLDDGLFKAVFHTPGRFPITKYFNKAGYNYFVLIEEQDCSYGDVNEDENVDIIDALLTAQFYVGLDISSFNAALADVNADSIIDIIDALLVAQYYVGLI